MKRLHNILSDSEFMVYFAAVILGTIICAFLVNKYLQRRLKRNTK